MNRTSKSSSNILDELRDSVHAVHMSTTELESALTHIDQRMNELFRFLISSRVALWTISILSLHNQIKACTRKMMRHVMDALYPCPIYFTTKFGFFQLVRELDSLHSPWVSRHDFFTHITVLFTDIYMTTVTYTSIYTNQIKIKWFLSTVCS